MSFETAVYSKLSADSTLMDTLTCLSPQQPVDDATFPFAWYKFERQDRLIFGAVATGISNYKFEINVFTKYNYQQVITLADLIIADLNGYVSLPDIKMMKLDKEAMSSRYAEGYIYYVKSLSFVGIGV